MKHPAWFAAALVAGFLLIIGAAEAKQDPCENGNPTDLCGGTGGVGDVTSKSTSKATAIGVGVGIGVSDSTSISFAEGGSSQATAEGGSSQATAEGGNAEGGKAEASSNSGGNTFRGGDVNVVNESKRQAPGIALGAARSTANCRVAGGIGGSGPGFGFGLNGSVMDENCAYLEASNHAAAVFGNKDDAHFLACKSEFYNKAPSCRKYDKQANTTDGKPETVAWSAVPQQDGMD